MRDFQDQNANRLPFQPSVYRPGTLRTPYVLDVRYAATKNESFMIMLFSFRARTGRLSFVDGCFPYIDSHVFVVSALCIFKNPIPARDPLLVSILNLTTIYCIPSFKGVG